MPSPSQVGDAGEAVRPVVVRDAVHGAAHVGELPGQAQPHHYGALCLHRLLRSDYGGAQQDVHGEAKLPNGSVSALAAATSLCVFLVHHANTTGVTAEEGSPNATLRDGGGVETSFAMFDVQSWNPL